MRWIRRLVLVAIAAAYWRNGRRWLLQWGATDSEAASTLPGDELIADRDGLSTRAITVNAPPEQVWPWIVQIGPAPRGGVYTYDWIENLLGLKMHSVDRILPEFQHPKTGDSISMGANEMVIELVDPNRAIAWRSSDGNWVWSFVLQKLDGRTRLISRNSFRLPRLADKLGMIPMEPASLVMERKMLLGMKQRAERSLN
jgi:hypothetical protein